MDGVQSFGENRAFRRTIGRLRRSGVRSPNEKFATVPGLNAPQVRLENAPPLASWRSERDSNQRYGRLTAHAMWNGVAPGFESGTRRSRVSGPRCSCCRDEATNVASEVQPTLNQRYDATEREQTRLKVTLFVNVFRIFRSTLTAHNGLVPGSSPGRPTMSIFASCFH
jgi:hypothetical protein